MNRKNRHGKALTSYEETVMELIIRMEESERHLQKYRNSNGAVIVVENGEEEHYPSFSNRKKKQEEVQIREFFRQEDHAGEAADDMAEYESSEVIMVKLTVWEWMEARKTGIVNAILMFSVVFLQIYIVWKTMDELSRRILLGIKYSCMLLLLWRAVRWIMSGGLHTYLNEES